jgi:cupin fold WbuC family metalloprotein
MAIKVFGLADLDKLSEEAAHSPRQRQHRNIHADYAEPCQRLFNAIEPGSYLRPHRHPAGQGPETMIAVRGLMQLVVFDNDGEIAETQMFGAGRHIGYQYVSIGVETPPGLWHTVVSMEPGSILLEIKAGPFDPSAPKVFAPWAPEEGCPGAAEYLKALVAALKCGGHRSPI